jgi:HSP20 family molecular chaperone IbpA
MRRLALPRDVKAEDISTVFENGMLTVDVKYDLARNAVKIPVAAANTPELASSNE